MLCLWDLHAVHEQEYHLTGFLKTESWVCHSLGHFERGSLTTRVIMWTQACLFFPVT